MPGEHCHPQPLPGAQTTGKAHFAFILCFSAVQFSCTWILLPPTPHSQRSKLFSQVSGCSFLPGSIVPKCLNSKQEGGESPIPALRACQDWFAGAVHPVPSFPVSGRLLCCPCCHHSRQLPLLHTLLLFGGFHSLPLHSCSSPSSCSKPGGTTGWQSQRQQLWALPCPCSETEHPQPGSVTPRRDKDGTRVLKCLSAGCEASKKESMINSPRESEAQSAG